MVAVLGTLPFPLHCLRVCASALCSLSQVGHFLPWKRHLYLAAKEGRKLAVGEIYQEYEVSATIVDQLQQHGVEVCVICAHSLHPC